MHAIITTGLGKTYPGGKEALKDLSLQLDEGEVFGFLGPNGAGKTTAVKLLTGMLNPTAGSALVMGHDPEKDPERVHALCGVVTENARMYDHLSGLENLMFYGALYGQNSFESRERADMLLAGLALHDAKDKKLGAYSTGMRQKLSFARALMHRPRMLFLDEPTSGMDPESGIKVNQMITRLAKEEGVTVFLCTHQLRYAQDICTRFGLISEGAMLMTGTLPELQNAVLPGIRVRIRADKLPAGLPLQEAGNGVFEGSLGEEGEVADLVRKIVLQGGDLYRVEVEKPSLEEIYFALTRNREAAK
ncbi:MAG: ABC transporter ATP-binding protein [Bacillota bacterium]|nr:ABC transporter ATP-binding protein [Bacillota bacterium]